MNKPNKRICLISAVSFFAGSWVGIFGLIVLLSLSQWNNSQRERKIEAFFYRTMNSIFKNTYDSKEGSVYTDALETIKEYEPRLGNICNLFITDSSPDYTEGTAFFPSGDFFYVLIDRKGKSWVINRFYLLNWEERWSETLYRIGER